MDVIVDQSGHREMHHQYVPIAFDLDEHDGGARLQSVPQSV